MEYNVTDPAFLLAHVFSSCLERDGEAKRVQQVI